MKAIKCTATITPAAGQGNPFSVAATQNITLDVPTPNETDFANPTRIDSLYPPITGPALWAGTLAAYQNGSQWNDSVTIPATPYTSTGDWAHLQIISVNGTHSSGGTATPIPNNGVTGLDGAFPYRLDGSYYKDNGTIVKDDGDSPGISLLDAYDNYTLNYSFDLYVMYFPPGATSIPVPLTKLTWTWSPNVNRPASKHWSDWPTGIAPGGNPIVSVAGTRCIDEPTWTTKISAH